MPGRKTRRARELDREIDVLLNQRARYMLVDAETGKDMREAHDFEIEHVQRHGNPAGGVGIELGGGWKVPVRTYRVRLRLLNVHQPTRAERRDPKLPPERFTALDRHGNTVATSTSVAGAMQHADRIFGYRGERVSVRGEYTSDGHHWGPGKGRVVATRENMRWSR